MIATSPTTCLQSLLDGGRPFRGREAVAQGLPWAYLSRAVADGKLIRLARGLYAPVDYAPSEHAVLAEVLRLVPNATIALLSAMRFHNLTTQVPRPTWILLDRSARRPSRQGLDLRVVTGSGPTLTTGVETHSIDGIEVPITSVARTVCDAFRFRRHVGLDVAIESLRDALERRQAAPSEIMDIAAKTRIGSVIRPYLEALS